MTVAGEGGPASTAAEAAMTLLPSRREPFLDLLRWLPGQKRSGGPAAPGARGGPWCAAGQEPALEAMLDDPIVRAVMASDDVTAQDVRRAVDSAAATRSR